MAWDGVIGQERAVALLERAAARPVHAYLLAGPHGSGVEFAAREFAARLVAPGDERIAALARRGRHPDVVEFEPSANTYAVDEARLAIVPELHRSPVEGERKVVVVHQADRMSPAVQNALLKSIEEPPARSVVLLVTSFPESLLDTVRSRCQRIDLDYVLDAPPSPAVRTIRDAFADAAVRVDGTGATALRLAGGLLETIKDALAAIEGEHVQELAELDEELERLQYPARTASAMRKRVLDRHKREDRRARTDLLLEGINALEKVYRDSLAGEHLDSAREGRSAHFDPARAARAVDACRDARQSFEFNPNEALLLEHLVLHLPAPARA
jgi:DNA polymerase-3 subunit delta'